MMKKYLLLSVLASLLLCSCGSEYHYANSFLRKHKWGNRKATETIFVCIPGNVLHTCSSISAIPGFLDLSMSQQDSLLAHHAQLLPQINDSIFLSQFVESMLYVVSRTKVPVIIVSDESQLPKADDQNYILNLVQLEAEEFVENTRSDFYTRRGVYYAYDYDLRHFATNAWFEFDAPDTATDLYFKNSEMSEEFHGNVTSIRDQKANVDGTFQRIQLADVYASARELGYECGRLFVERVLHEQVRLHEKNDWYLYYNFYGNSINVMVYGYDEILKAEGFQKVSE